MNEKDKCGKEGGIKERLHHVFIENIEFNEEVWQHPHVHTHTPTPPNAILFVFAFLQNDSLSNQKRMYPNAREGMA